MGGKCSRERGEIVGGREKEREEENGVRMHEREREGREIKRGG